MKGIAIGPAKQDCGESHGLQAVESADSELEGFSPGGGSSTFYKPR